MSMQAVLWEDPGIEADEAEDVYSYEAAYEPNLHQLMIITLCNGEPITDIIYPMGETPVYIVKDERGDSFIEFVDDENKLFRYPLVRIDD